MAKTAKTTKTSAARKAAPKNTSAKPAAVKSKRKAAPPAASLDINWKQALIGGGIGAAVGGLATKLIFLR